MLAVTITCSGKNLSYYSTSPISPLLLLPSPLPLPFPLSPSSPLLFYHLYIFIQLNEVEVEADEALSSLLLMMGCWIDVWTLMEWELILQGISHSSFLPFNHLCLACFSCVSHAFPVRLSCVSLLRLSCVSPASLVRLSCVSCVSLVHSYTSRF